MDKFLVKLDVSEPVPTQGLELLANPLRIKKRADDTDTVPDYGNLSPHLYEQNLEQFRTLMTQRASEFRPHHYRDPIDYMIEAIWFHFLFHDTPASSQPATLAEYKQERDYSSTDINLLSNIA